MGITKLGLRRYRIEIDRGRTLTGKRDRYYETVTGSKKQAQARDRELRRLLDTGIEIEPSKLTVEEWLDQWIRNYAQPAVSARTLATYKETVAIFTASLGSVRLRDLRPEHIQATIVSYLASGRTNRTAQKHFVVFKGALRRAVRLGLLYRNPADAVEPPRPKRTEMRTADVETLTRVLEQCEQDDLRRIIYIAVQTGLRAGELLGLTWSDVDWEHGQIGIRRARNSFEASGFAEPKARSRRSLAVSQGTLDVLREQRAAQKEQWLALGGRWSDRDLIFPRRDGSAETVDNLSNRWGSLRDRLGLEGLRFHDLRHTSATLALEAGVHPKVVQERLGHANIGVTLDTYSHVLPNMQRAAAETLDAMVPRPRERGAS